MAALFLTHFEPCDWSDCPKAHLSLVETGSNVLEEEYVLGWNANYSTSLHKLVLTDKTGFGRNYYNLLAIVWVTYLISIDKADIK